MLKSNSKLSRILSPSRAKFSLINYPVISNLSVYRYTRAYSHFTQYTSFYTRDSLNGSSKSLIRILSENNSRARNMGCMMSSNENIEEKETKNINSKPPVADESEEDDGTQMNSAKRVKLTHGIEAEEKNVESSTTKLNDENAMATNSNSTSKDSIHLSANGDMLTKSDDNVSTDNNSKPDGIPPVCKFDKADRGTIDYLQGSRLFLAPMVRIGTLPMRLVSLQHGASLVWGPEIIDRAVIESQRVVLGNEEDGTKLVNFVDKAGKLVFQAHEMEKSRLVYQIGTSDADLAVKAAKKVMHDVAAIDLNCGCPKSFSIKGGMGAALLRMPDRLCGILTALVREIPLPISCKIRLLETDEKTAVLVKRILDTGISCLTVHGRTKDMRSSEPALYERIRKVVETVRGYEAELAERGEKRDRVVLVANGDCTWASDAASIVEKTGVDAVMVARGAESNPTCFSKQRPANPSQLPVEEHDGNKEEEGFAHQYVKIARAVNNNLTNSKYVLSASSLFPTLGKKARNQFRQGLHSSNTYQEIFDVFGIKFGGEQGQEQNDDGEEKWKNLVGDDPVKIREFILATCPRLGEIPPYQKPRGLLQ